MYRRILVAVENSASDRTILTHVQELAAIMRSELLLVHVADGVVARHFDDLQLRESEEMKDDRAYLERLSRELQARGLSATTILAAGDPVTELLRVAQEQHGVLFPTSPHGR